MQIQPANDEKTLIKHYWTRRTEDFTQLRLQEWNSNKYQRWMQEILPHLPSNQSLRILDVGCGCGFFSVMLASLGHQVTGIDLAESMIEKGIEIADSLALAIDYQVMDAEHLDFDDEQFDVVISRNLTWTLPNPLNAYKEWIRVLKKGGIFMNFDGAYGYEALNQKGDSKPLPPNHAHRNIPPDLDILCQQIYQMLHISYMERPQWDQAVLRALGCRTCRLDTDLGKRIYKETDQFYNPVPMFFIYAEK